MATVEVTRARPIDPRKALRISYYTTQTRNGSLQIFQNDDNIFLIKMLKNLATRLVLTRKLNGTTQIWNGTGR